MLAFVGILFTMAMTYTHPLYLGAMLVTVSSIILYAGAGGVWKRYLTAGLLMAPVIILINALFNHLGETVFFTVPSLLFLRESPVTLESVAYGANMAVKIILAVSIFCLYNETVDSDRVFMVASRFFPKSAITAVMTGLMIPRIRRDFIRIRNVMSARGAALESGHLFKRLRASYPIWKILLLSSLEGAWDMSEAMHSKGFGSGRRTYYSSTAHSASDNAVLGLSLAGMALYAATLYYEAGFYEFFPVKRAFIQDHDLLFIFLISVFLLSILLLDKGFRRWNFSR